MANVCCVCKSKISGWAKERPVSKALPSEFYCETCYEKIKTLEKRPVTDEMKFNSALKYINGYLENGEIKSEVVAVLEDVKSGLSESVVQAEKLAEAKRKYDKIMRSNGHNFEGYKITKYIDIVTSEVVLGTGFGSEISAGFADFFGTKSEAFRDKLASARSDAMEEILQLTHEKGGNAIIGVDYNYHQFNANLIGVIISGTAVFIEEI